MSLRSNKLLDHLSAVARHRMQLAERTAAVPAVRKRRWSGLESLEGRLLYSVSPLGADLLPPPPGDESIAAIEAESEPWAAIDRSERAHATDGAVEQHVRRELVIVDASTPDYQTLVDDILRGAGETRDIEVVVLNSTSDGVDQISALLGEYRDLDAVHLVSHGTDAGIQLGSGWLTAGNVAGYAEQIAGWGDVLTADGDLLIYGCDLASSEDGRGFVDALAGLTGADVAASTDRTGSAALGGDWDLEHATGEIDTHIAFSADIQLGWRNVLDATNPLWLSTDRNVTGGGQTGTDTWQKGDLVQMTGPTLQFAAGPTNGSFSVALDIDLFAAGAETNATHYVTADIQVGASDFQLKAGDVLLSLASGETLSSGSVAMDPGFTNSLTVEKSDVFVFRPDTPGDYSAGTFAMLLEDFTDGDDVRGISLLEHDVRVGDADLYAGDFVFTVDDDGGNDLWLFETTDVGAGNTVGTSKLLLDGDDAGISIDKGVSGVDVLERNLMLGDRLLAAGTVLLSVDNTDTVGADDLAVTEFDIFAFNVTKTTLVALPGNGMATASAFFVGGEVAFNAGAEELDAFTLTSVNEASVVTATAANLGYTENDAATAIDPGLTISDIDDWELDGATVRITSGFAAGEDVLAFTDQLGISGSYNAGTGVLTLSGTSSVANYQTALRSVTYQNTSEDPSTTSREITFEVTDGDNLGSATRDVAITAENDASVVTTTPLGLDYVENDAATPIDTGLTVTDVDDTVLEGATVRIDAGFVASEDVLAFTDQLGITGSYDAATGVLTLSGTSSVANYQAALRTVTYENTSDDPSTVLRKITFRVDDGDVVASAVSTVTVTAENDDPTGAIADVAVAEDAPDTVIDLFAAFHDAEEADSALVYSVQGNTNPSLFTSVTLDPAAGTLSLGYVPNIGGTAELTVRATDGAGTFVETTFTVTVSPENDAPVLVVAGSAATHSGTIVITSEMLRVSDVDNTAAEITYALTGAPGVGSLKLNGIALNAGDTFTQEDIDDGRITYDLGVIGDAFEFTVSDGAGGVIDATNFAVAVTAPILPPEVPQTHGPEPVEIAAPIDEESVVEEAEAEDTEDELHSALLESQPQAVYASVAMPESSDGPEAPSATQSQIERHAPRARAEGAERGSSYVARPADSNDDPGIIITRLAGAALDFTAQMAPLWDQLDQLSERMTSSASGDSYVAGSATFVFAGVSAGYAVALVRGGSLIGSMLSSMPAWQFVDPLPILDDPSAGGPSEPGDDESLASMIEDASA